MAENFTSGETISLVAQTSAGGAAFSLAQSASYPDCLITNAGSATAFIAFGLSTATVAALPAPGSLNSVPVLAGESIVLRKGVGSTYCAGITLSGSTTLYFTAGQGN